MAALSLASRNYPLEGRPVASASWAALQLPQESPFQQLFLQGPVA